MRQQIHTVFIYSTICILYWERPPHNDLDNREYSRPACKGNSFSFHAHRVGPGDVFIFTFLDENFFDFFACDAHRAGRGTWLLYYDKTQIININSRMSKHFICLSLHKFEPYKISSKICTSLIVRCLVLIILVFVANSFHSPTQMFQDCVTGMVWGQFYNCLSVSDVALMDMGKCNG